MSNSYKLFDLKVRRFLSNRLVTFHEGFLSNPLTKVEHSHQNINTNLLTSLDILHTNEYKGAITKERMQKLDEDEAIETDVTHYHPQILFKSSICCYHANKPCKNKDGGW